jgi:hypothetical protein
MKSTLEVQIKKTRKGVIRMKSTLLVIAVALTLGLLVASGAAAQQAGSDRQIDVMGPEYNKTPSPDSAVAGGAKTPEIAPPAPRKGIDVMEPESTATPSRESTAVGGVETELPPPRPRNP